MPQTIGHQFSVFIGKTFVSLMMGCWLFSDPRILGAAATFLLSQASIQAILEVTQKIRVLYLRPEEFQQPIKIRRINGFKV